MNNEKSIELINELIEINNDRIEGYDTATEETKELDLKSIFSDLTLTSHKLKQELSKEITQLGGTVTEGTTTRGKFFRVWMDVKAALTSNDRKAILDSCEYGEDAALEKYESVLKNDSEYLSTEQLDMIRAQHSLLKADHDKVKTMRDDLVAHV